MAWRFSLGGGTSRFAYSLLVVAAVRLHDIHVCVLANHQHNVDVD
jgi:hypothetical protein